jgi:hypothetical protein
MKLEKIEKELAWAVSCPTQPSLEFPLPTGPPVSLRYLCGDCR